AVGKSDLALEFASKVKGEIISADSMQIYKLMNIGTAKPDINARCRVNHHLIDLIYPDEDYSVALFKKDAEEAIELIYKKGKLPIMVGGTGLYVNSITNKVNYSETGPDYNLREYLDNISNEKGIAYLFNMLGKIDPVTAARIEVNDKKRIIRALEVYYKTGYPISYYKEISGNVPNDMYNILIFGLIMDRNKLYSKIEKRVDTMMKNGLIEEVEMLLSLGYDEYLNSMQAIGYKQIIGYLKGRSSLEEAVQLIKRDTRRYAKRQLTWFRRDKRIEWFDLDKLNKEGVVKNIIERLAGICK
ncbi:MAG: tRNA (adenosine(37)-N6)-dimethylallyltransferase MiaA, partial [Thermoanaerobacteraceae bacterium]|nr:tRNA (adenosine(37)-N6)-dimethylallyltransferase MiaA [Thermoanaerobacteraceae bacterium]